MADATVPGFVRVLLGVYAVTRGVTGLWAAAFPRSFFDDYPGGWTWVSVDGPYNEHLTRDVGTLNLALAVLVAAAAIVGSARLAVIAAAVTLVNAVPHFLYHLTHLDGYDKSDAASSITALIAAMIVPAIVLVWLARNRTRFADRSP